MKLIEQIHKKFEEGSITREIDFNLKTEELTGLLYGQNFKCYLTGDDFIVTDKEENTYSLKDKLNLEVSRNTTLYNYNCSIDRVDNLLGYSISNSKFCTKLGNMIKKDFSFDTLLVFCFKVVMYNKDLLKKMGYDIYSR